MSVFEHFNVNMCMHVCTYVCVSMHVYVCVCVCVCLCVCMCVCMYVVCVCCICVCADVHLHVFYICMRVFVCERANVQIRMFLRACVRACKCVSV
jgi:hypothetical protein